MAKGGDMTRRGFLGAMAASAAAAPLASARADSNENGRKPNVIVIMTDDQSYMDAGCYGSPYFKTPALDRIAEEGVRFTQFYGASSVCTPSRAGMLTGSYPVRVGLPGNTSSQPGEPGLSSEHPTMARMFKEAGYATAHVGKWHLGYSEDTMPNAHGFDHSFGHMGGCIDNYSHFFYWSGPNQHDLWRNGERARHYGEFFPDLMVKEAKWFMEEHKDEPFFLFFPMNTPHYPYQGSLEWLEYYEDLPYPRNLYAAFLSTQDDKIGELLDAVDELGLTEDTIIVFQPDHGHSEEERAHFGGGDSGPYRAGKFSCFEGGIRLPTCVRWPGKIPAGEVRDQMGHGCDWMPTLAEFAGVPLVNENIDGKSITDVIVHGAQSPHDVLHWDQQPFDQWAVREGPWKLIGNVRDETETGDLLTEEDRTLFLANLEEDPGEMTNFASERPEIVERMQQLRDDFVASL